MNKKQLLVVWVGWMILLLSGLYMVFVGLINIYKWRGLLGVIIALILTPLTGAIFPFIYWIKESIFPTFYFVVWGFGILAMILIGYSKGFSEQKTINAT